jgi:6-pyruvoyltetrahydropterin/6-carboxytetrahydropterin synthase
LNRRVIESLKRQRSFLCVLDETSAISAVKSFLPQSAPRRLGERRDEPAAGVFNEAMIQWLNDSLCVMKAHLSRRYRFSASHRLHSEQMSNEENRAVYGKCNNPHGHGHNYVLEVTVSGQVDKNGMVCNLADLDDCVRREILSRFDIENLNLRPEFADSVPTTEKLCTVIFELLNQDILKRKFTQAHLQRVRLEETMMNSFEYEGD